MSVRKSIVSASIMAFGATVLLGACSKSLSGTYTDQSGNVTLTFQSGGKVKYQASETGFTEEDTYSIKDKKVTIKSTGGTVGIFEIKPNGCLNSPTMGELCQPKTSS